MQSKQCFSMALVPRLPQVLEENGKKAHNFTLRYFQTERFRVAERLQLMAI